MPQNSRRTIRNPFVADSDIQRLVQSGALSWEEANELLRNQVSTTFGAYQPTSSEETQGDTHDPHNSKFKEQIKKETKKRHLNRDERQRLHKPLSDILPDEVPRRAVDLKFDDIVSSIS